LFSRATLFVLGVSTGLVLSSPAQADIDPAELQAHTALKDRKSQATALRQIEIDKAAEAKREAEEALAAERAEAERRRADAARPWPVRLTEQRCTLCHPAVNYTRNAHALPGWWAVTLRMKYVNNAPVNWEELRVIVTHLAETQPTRGIDYVIEWALAVLLLSSPLLIALAGLVARRLIRRRRQ
jgi:hypothetical protein